MIAMRVNKGREGWSAIITYPLKDKDGKDMPAHCTRHVRESGKIAYFKDELAARKACEIELETAVNDEKASVYSLKTKGKFVLGNGKKARLIDMAKKIFKD